MNFKHQVKILSVLLIFISIASVNAQQHLAQQAYAIFEQSCLICHGENGSYTEALIIEHTTLIDDGKVVPDDPEGSVFYQRLIETDVTKRMPQGQPALEDAAIETIRQWILAGAPDWDAVPRPETDFITIDTMLETIENHVNSLSMRDKSFARYFTLTHLYNAGETTETLNAYRRALSKLINSLSWGREIVKPQPIDVGETVFYIDLRDYEWDVRNDAWTQIEQVYPYQMTFDAPTQTDLREKLTLLQQETNSEVPFVHVDWFLATASLPPLYNNILALPETANELETELRVSVAENLQNAPGKRVWRAGFSESGVSRHNRVVERHTTQHGAYWKSYDFAGSADSQNIFTHPLDFIHDGGEIIFNLPNGLQAYFLVDEVGNRLDVAPTDIVSNPAASDPAVRNGLSCIGCHTEGMKTFEDEVRAVVEQAENPPYNKDLALDLYVEESVMVHLLGKDTQRYKDALEAAGGVFGGIEPIQRFHEAFQGPLDATYAAASAGLETEVFLEKISNNVSLQNLGLQVLTIADGKMKRDAWTSNFAAVIDVLNTIDSVLPPIDQRPERIPGLSVHIPDVNLRAALEEALGKASGDVITVEEMESLTEFYAEGLGIKDITGLEYAINLHVLQIRGNMIVDISLVSGLTKLSLLRIADNKISDISAIAGLTNIGSLEIYANKITDISPISGLTNIGWLSMYDNPVTDISPLASLKNLKGIRVSVEEGGDLSPLSELTNLEDIFYWGSGKPIPDLSPIARLQKLKFLDIHGEGQPDLSLLAQLNNLERFEFWGSGENLPDLSPLKEAMNLKEMWVINCGMSDLTILDDFTGLERLNLERNNISDVSPLAKLTKLKWLKLLDNPISDYSPLTELSQTTNIIAGNVNIPDRNLRAAIAEALGKDNTGIISITFDEMTSLTGLTANDRGIHDLTGLEHAINATWFTLENNKISDLSPLEGLEKLTSLGLAVNQITDLTPLSSLLNLTHLSIYNNLEIISLSPLSGLISLEYIALVGSGNISDISPLSHLTNLKHILIWGSPISDLFPLSSLTQLEILDICGANNPDISPLSKLTGLKRLYLASNGISNVSPLSELKSLTHLNLEWNKISDVSPLAVLTQLKWLGLHHNLISDFSPLTELSETTISRAFNPGAPIGGPKIEGPWLWTIIPAIHLDKTTDLLAEASDGVVSEKHIATFGAKSETSIGNNMWIAGKIAPSGDNNIAGMLDTLGIETIPNVNDRIIYGSVILNSPEKQYTNMFVGSNNAVKIWLNGELVYQNLTWYDTRAHNYHDFFPVTLKSGTNVLLVAVDYRPWLSWKGFFGFEEDTEYTLIPPGVGFTFSVAETDLLAGDTFTLNLNAENIYNLAGWQVDLAFDPNILEAVEVTEGDFLKSEGKETFFNAGIIDNSVGKISGISSARLADSGVTGTGTLLSVMFLAKAGGETQLTLENYEFGSISGDIIPAVTPIITIIVGEYPAWDVNQDGRVSILDLILVARDFGSGAPANLRTDVNRDGFVNIQDLIIVAQHMGETTDSATAPIVAMDDKELTPAIVQAWISQAQIEDDGSLAFRQGIDNLKQLLATLLPEKTALLANYPNPFNPETWIPYQLAKPADVTLTIYAANGAVVRTLTLGHQAAGIYQRRNRAVHWDGKNEVGEEVASGIYFYTLIADDFTSTRKLSIRK